jgi:hypothetical protein
MKALKRFSEFINESDKPIETLFKLGLAGDLPGVILYRQMAGKKTDWAVQYWTSWPEGTPLSGEIVRARKNPHEEIIKRSLDRLNSITYRQHTAKPTWLINPDTKEIHSVDQVKLDLGIE